MPRRSSRLIAQAGGVLRPVKIQAEAYVAGPDVVVHTGRFTYEQADDEGQRQDYHRDDDEQCHHGDKVVPPRQGSQDTAIERREEDPQNSRPADRSRERP